MSETEKLEKDLPVFLQLLTLRANLGQALLDLPVGFEIRKINEDQVMVRYVGDPEGDVWDMAELPKAVELARKQVGK